MTPDSFKAWRRRLGLTQAGAAEALGLSARQIAYYEAGQREDGRAVVVPRTVALACAALEAGLTAPGR
jgi:transcriptional regulator with XRE-family HTH domain